MAKTLSMKEEEKKQDGGRVARAGLRGSYSNREASVTDASVSSGAARQHFRLATRIATQQLNY
jgi:hypothetical protein